jgi:hypothetical protein
MQKTHSVLRLNLFLWSVVERCFKIINLSSNDTNFMYNSLSRKMKLAFYQKWVCHCSAAKSIHDTMPFKIIIGCAVIKSIFKSLLFYFIFSMYFN